MREVLEQRLIVREVAHGLGDPVERLLRVLVEIGEQRFPLLVREVLVEVQLLLRDGGLIKSRSAFRMSAVLTNTSS